MERKKEPQAKRAAPKDDYALVDAQNMMDVADATNSVRLMVDGKNASMSVIVCPGINVDNKQFAGATQDVWRVEAVVSAYNESSAPFMSANGATALQQDIMTQACELVQPLDAIKSGVNSVTNGIVRMISA
jgi:hypothetical protein